jgi:hypothetical protein
VPIATTAADAPLIAARRCRRRATREDTEQVPPEHFRGAVFRKPAENRIDVGHDRGLEVRVGVGKRGSSRAAEDTPCARSVRASSHASMGPCFSN